MFTCRNTSLTGLPSHVRVNWEYVRRLVDISTQRSAVYKPKPKLSVARLFHRHSAPVERRGI